MKSDFPKCGEIYWIELDPTVGSETKKRRPCVILSNNAYNKYSSRVVAAPVTSQIKGVYPCEFVVDIAGKPGKVMMDQVRSFDKQRLGRKLSELDNAVMDQLGDTLKRLFDFL